MVQALTFFWLNREFLFIKSRYYCLFHKELTIDGVRSISHLKNLPRKICVSLPQCLLFPSRMCYEWGPNQKCEGYLYRRTTYHLWPNSQWQPLMTSTKTNYHLSQHNLGKSMLAPSLGWTFTDCPLTQAKEQHAATQSAIFIQWDVLHMNFSNSATEYFISKT